MKPKPHWQLSSNQGYLEEHGSDSIRFRADDLDDLMRIALSEIKGDERFSEPGFASAIRDAIFEAQDLEVD
jgi:hypothetical protein